MTGAVAEEEKERRWQEIMDLQSSISRKKNEALIGSIQRVMIDEFDHGSERASGRTQAHAPEVDGAVYVDWSREDGGGARGGEMVDVRITAALDYDLMGEKFHA